MARSSSEHSSDEELPPLEQLLSNNCPQGISRTKGTTNFGGLLSPGKSPTKRLAILNSTALSENQGHSRRNPTGGRLQRSLRTRHPDSLLVRSDASKSPSKSWTKDCNNPGSTANDHSDEMKRRLKSPVRYDMQDSDDVDSSNEYHASDKTEDSMSFYESDGQLHARSSQTPAILSTGQSRTNFRPLASFDPTSPRKPLDIVQLTGPLKELDLNKSPEDEQNERRTRNIQRSTAEDSEPDDIPAFIKFSPPSRKSPIKSPPPPRPTTPTSQKQCSSPSPSRSKLKSPSKKTSRIPPTPHRPSVDAFWSADIINSWNEHHSPQKTMQISPRKAANDSLREFAEGYSDSEGSSPSPSASPRKRIGTVQVSPKEFSKQREEMQARKDFNASKHALAASFLKQLDQRITQGTLSSMTASTGGINLNWSNKLNSTAGRANWRREAVRSPLDISPSKLPFTNQAQHGTTATTQSPEKNASVTYRHIATIDLATKVIDTPSRLHNVLAHEYCHLANFMISRVLDKPHGASFRGWADKVTNEFGRSHGVEVTTKHEYEIVYRFAWMCVGSSGGVADARKATVEAEGCGMEYARHSRSIDPSRHTCGRCRGRLVQTRPKPRAIKSNTNTKQEGTAGTAGPSDYQRFVKQSFASVRGELPPGSPMKDVMREVGARYRESKKELPKKNEKSGSDCEVVEILEGDGADGKDVDGVVKKLDFLTVGA